MIRNWIERDVIWYDGDKINYINKEKRNISYYKQLIFIDELKINKMLKEKVINKKVSKVYSYNDVLNWIRFGLNNKLINFNNKEEIGKWVGLLKGKEFDI